MKPKPLSDDDLQNAIAVAIDDAILYCDEEAGNDREKATNYYRGDISEDLADIPGRSRVVSRDVRDVVLQIMPSLVRIFLGSQGAIEFQPKGPEDEPFAEQATDYARYVLEQNESFSVFYAAFKDALIRRTGIVKVWWEDSTTVSGQRFEGVDEQTFALFSAEAEASAQDVVITNAEVVTDAQGVATYSFNVETKKRDGRIKIEAVPPEEFIISRDAKSDRKFSLIGHRSYPTVSDLVAMGLDYEQVIEHAGEEDDTDMTGEADARRNSGYTFGEGEQFVDPATRKVLYVEAYKYIDADGDGIAELRKICTIGQGYKVVMNEVVDDHPFATFCPEPEPHTFFGLSLMDCLEDIQLIRSQLMRHALDGLSSVLTPRMLYKQGAVDVKQLMDARPGGLVGVTSMDAVMPLPTDKAAPQLAMEAYNLMGSVRADRTGQNQASMGLTPDALQSVSRIASNELVQQAQSRVEMIARIFAETGFKRVAKLILKLSTRYQDKATVVRLRNNWVSIDPRQWNPDMDVSVNVGLGKGNVEERTMFYRELLQVQQAIMQAAGPQNPWVDAEKVRNALEGLCEAAGQHADKFIMSRDEWTAKQQQMAQQPAQPPKPDPAELLAKVEADKISASIQRDNQKLQFEQQQELLKDDRERDYNEARIIIDCAKAGVDPNYVLSVMRQIRMASPSQVQ